MKESELQPKEEPSKQRVSKPSAERALPRSGAETLVKIIKGYAVASNGGETQINYKDVASAAGVGPTVVSSNNSFLLESEILTSSKYGFYVPTENAVRYAREAAWDEAGAKVHLRKSVVACWYGQVATQNFILRPSLTREELKRALAIKADATEGDSNALEFLVDFIIYTGLVVENENGTLVKGNFDELTRTPVGSATKGVLQPSVESARSSRANEAARPSEQSISLVLHVHVSDLDELTLEHAARLRDWLRTLQEQRNTGEVHLEGKELGSGS